MAEYEPTERDIAVAQSLGRIEGKLDELNTRNNDFMEQLKDHARRIEQLERRQMWTSGWVAGALALGAAIEWLIGRM